MLITLYTIGGVHFRLLGTNGFQVQAKIERLLLRASIVVRTSNMKISRRRLADCTKLHQKACCTCSTIIFLHSTNQIIDLWRCRRQILNSLLHRRDHFVTAYVARNSKTVKIIIIVLLKFLRHLVEWLTINSFFFLW